MKTEALMFSIEPSDVCMNAILVLVANQTALHLIFVMMMITKFDQADECSIIENVTFFSFYINANISFEKYLWRKLEVIRNTYLHAFPHENHLLYEFNSTCMLVWKKKLRQ